jgi:stress-induced-phosphoprotein 1
MPISSEEEIPADYCYINGNIYFKMKKFQEAHDQYQEAITIDPSHGDSYNNLAALYFQVKQYQKALNYLNQAEENGAKVNPEFKKVVLKALEK